MFSRKNVRLSFMFARIVLSLLCISGGVALHAAQRNTAKVATPAESMTVLKGFQVELIRNAGTNEGSWVAMCVDPQGRLIISPQGKEPMLRITLDAAGKVGNVEKLNLAVGSAMGLRYAFGHLYVNGTGPEGYHMYRLRDTDGKGTYGAPELIRKWKGGPGEHGAHGIVVGPDNKLYVVNGNFVDVPEDILPTSPHKNYADDQILPRMEDGNGFGAGRKPPGGYVIRMDPDGKNAELFGSGQRNTYDIAFNADGELFGFDSDMEWDWGSPWYRPTRAFHITSGADHGFREGSAKWPTYYEDSLPTVADIGIGSPTGVLVPTKAKFPTAYRNAVWMMDWSYGRIVAVHLKSKGAGYAGTFETILRGKPLNVTDMEVGTDGAVYFATGGRGTQSGLYRVTHPGIHPIDSDFVAVDRNAQQARELRHQLEKFHGKRDAKAVETAWPHLGSADRYLRYAARIAIEAQPVDEWKSKALSENNPRAALTALLALARVGASSDQTDLANALAKFPTASLEEELQLLKLRVIEVSIARHGRPSDEIVQRGIEKLSPLYPAKSWPLNRELSHILIYFNAPGVVQKTLDLVGKAETQEEQLHYMVALRNAKSGWTIEDRKRYLSWFRNRSAGQDAGPTYPAGGNYFVNASTKHPAQFTQWFEDVGIKAGNGASYNNFIKKLKLGYIDQLTPNERAQLAALLVEKPVPAIAEAAANRKIVREWKMSDFADEIAKPLSGRNFTKGKEMFAIAQCSQCHQLGGEGGAVGPDLAGAGAKYSRRDLLEAILEPSKVLSDQYQNIIVTTKDGEDIVGRLVDENDRTVAIVPNMLTGDRVDVKKGNIKERRPSKLSPMPEGLVNIMTKEEILDLVAYLESGARKEHAAFKTAQK